MTRVLSHCPACLSERETLPTPSSSSAAIAATDRRRSLPPVELSKRRFTDSGASSGQCTAWKARYKKRGRDAKSCPWMMETARSAKSEVE
eukprot:scaffold53275_cov32-Tisochrysis_lutea.AAC.3